MKSEVYIVTLLVTQVLLIATIGIQGLKINSQKKEIQKLETIINLEICRKIVKGNLK